MKVKSLRLKKYKVLEDFEIKFTSNGKVNPVTVICGINGSGKTSILDFLYNVFAKGEKVPSEVYDNNIIDFDISIFENDRESSYIITKPLLRRMQEEYSSNMIYYKAYTEIFDVDNSIVKYVDKLIYEEDTKSSEAYEKTRNKINEILTELDLDIEFEGLNKEKEVFFRNKKSSNLEIYDLSSGEREILTKLIPLYLSDIKDSMVLIDEPETSLHPNWQSHIVKLYEKIAINNNLQIIITTHSPFIVGAVKENCLKLLRKDGGTVNVVDSYTKSYGKRVDEILLEIFGIKGLRTPSVDAKISRLKQMLNNKEFETQQFKELLEDLEGIIGKNDRDLVLIRLEIARLSK